MSLVARHGGHSLNVHQVYPDSSFVYQSTQLAGGGPGESFDILFTCADQSEEARSRVSAGDPYLGAHYDGMWLLDEEVSAEEAANYEEAVRSQRCWSKHPK
jgi:hypothetical protein